MRTRRAASLHPLGDLGPGHAVHAEREADVLLERHVRIEGVVLEDHRHVALARRREGHVDAVDRHPPGVGDLQAGDDAEGRRLAGAGGAEEREELTGGDAEVDALQRAEAAVVLDDGFEDHFAGGGHRPHLWRC